MYAVVLVVLEYVYKLNLSLFALSVTDGLSRRLQDVVFVLRPLQHPLDILERHLVVMGNEEALHGATQPLVEIEYSTIHVDEDHVVVKEKAVDDGESKNDEDGQVDAYQTARLLLVVIVVEAEVIAEGPGLIRAI